MATVDPSYILASWATIGKRVHDQYETEKASKVELKTAQAVALTGDHWTSVSKRKVRTKSSNF